MQQIIIPHLRFDHFIHFAIQALIVTHPIININVYWKKLDPTQQNVDTAIIDFLCLFLLKTNNRNKINPQNNSQIQLYIFKTNNVYINYVTFMIVLHGIGYS